MIQLREALAETDDKESSAKANEAAVSDKYLAHLAVPKIQMVQLDQIYCPQPTERLYSIEMSNAK